MGKSSDKRPLTRYKMTVHFAVCHAVDELRAIYIGEKEAWSGLLTEYEQLRISDRQFFGGSKLEGGIEGIVTYYPGDASQQLITKHAGKLDLTPSTAPAYRGLCTVWFEELPEAEHPGFYWIGQNPYMKPVWFKVARESVGLNTAYARIYRGTQTKRSIYFAIDNSGSMDTVDPGQSLSRWEILVAAMDDALDRIKADIEAGLQIDVGLAGWSAGGGEIRRLNADAADIEEIRSFLAGFMRLGGTDFDIAADYIHDWFTDSLSDADIVTRVGVFITDGLPDGGGDGASAAAILADELSATGGSFNTAAGTEVQLFGINIVLTDTSETEFLDNTEEDGVPVTEDEAGLSAAISAALYPDELEFDSNPAHIIYECLTNADWGAGIAAASVDISAFEAAALTLYGEGLGLSMVWMQQASIEDFIREVLDHIDAVLYISPLTGKITLKLIRDDYDEGTLDTLTVDNANITNWQRKATGELVNEVVVTWTNPNNEEEESVIVQDFGGIAAQGTVISDTRNYYGVRKRSLAFKLAQRDLRASSMPLASCEAEVNRSAWAYVPGDVVKVNTPEDGISSIVMRVVGVDYGQPGDSTIRLSLVEDVFGKEIQEYDEPPETEWTDPVPDPADMAYVQILTLPYLLVVDQIDASLLSGREYPDTFAGVFAAQSTSGTTEFDLWTGPTTYTLVDTLSTVTRGLLPTGGLSAEVTSTLSGLDSMTQGVGLVDGAFLFIGSGDGDDMEIAEVTADSPVTLKRGVLDTVPKAWSAGTPVWIFYNQQIGDPTIRAESEVAYYKLLSRTGAGVLAIGSATERTATLTARPFAPFRPANVKVNGNAGFSGDVDITADSPPDLVVTFNTRNRLTEDTTILEWDDASVSGEVGQTAVIELRDADTNTLLQTYSSVTSPYTVPSGDYAGYARVTVQVFAERDGIRSIQGHQITVQVAPFDGHLLLETGDMLDLETGGTDDLLLE